MGLFNKIKNIFKTENIEENVSDIPEKVENKKKSVEVYEKGLTKSREGFVSRLASLTNKYKKATDEYFDELEEILIMADIGVNTVTNFIEKLRDRVKNEKIESTEDLKEIIIDELFIIYVNEDVLVNKINFQENGPTVVLFVGVNGVGKTTTIGKLAQKFKNEGKKVLHNVVGFDAVKNKIEVECALQYTDSYSENVVSFVNNVKTSDGGSHEVGLKSALTKVFNDYAKNNGYLKAKDKNFEGTDVREGLTVVLSLKIPEDLLQFEGQTKGKLGTPQARTAVEALVFEKLQFFLEENKKII